MKDGGIQTQKNMEIRINHSGKVSIATQLLVYSLISYNVQT